MTQHLAVDVGGGESLPTTRVQTSPITARIIDVAYRYADARGIARKLLLPPAADARTAITYWERAQGEWHTCPDCRIKVWPFVACCPTCLLYNSKFTKVKANKPHPAKISVATTDALLDTLQVCVHRAGRSEIILRANAKNVDAVLLLAYPRPVLAEMKTSPFITPPLIQIDNQPCVQLPFGTIHRHLDDGFFMQFFDDWLRLWPEYGNTSTSDRILQYYLTNGCGEPPGTKINISDGKTSVGLDRSDDIWKGFAKTFDTKLDHGDAVLSIVLSNLPPKKHATNLFNPKWFDYIDGVVSLGGPMGIQNDALAEFASFDWIESNASLLEAAQ